MKVTPLDRSNYFKGLLLLIRKDRTINEPEIEMMKRIGKTLGFEAEFLHNAIHEVMDNTHIVDEPPEFSTKELAAKFIKDGLVMACSDDNLHPSEEEWLRSTAERNGLDAGWFQSEIDGPPKRKEFPQSLEADDLVVDYSLSHK